jgi:lipid A 3-O-deacylase
MKLLRALALSLGLFLFGVLAPARAQQGPVAGGHELQVWTSGGYGVKGIEQHTGLWSAGARYGWILTGPHGPGFLRGRFEYAVDLVPIFAIHQHVNTAYGAAVNPLDLKWDFDSHGRFVPYMELSGGTLFTNNQIPPGTSRVNFESACGFGVHVLKGRLNWTADVRYVHISNAGLYPINPGINTIQLRVGLGLFTHGRS